MSLQVQMRSLVITWNGSVLFICLHPHIFFGLVFSSLSSILLITGVIANAPSTLYSFICFYTYSWCSFLSLPCSASFSVFLSFFLSFFDLLFPFIFSLSFFPPSLRFNYFPSLSFSFLSSSLPPSSSPSQSVIILCLSPILCCAPVLPPRDVFLPPL